MTIGKTKVKEENKIIPVAELLGNKVIVSGSFDELTEKSYGKTEGKKLELSLSEALCLLSHDNLEVKKGKSPVGEESLRKAGLKHDKRFNEKYAVYSDLRERGLVVKTGFKFGCDFRVYKRGVSVRKGPKASGEHTRWIVFVVQEDYSCAFQELSRAVRLAHSIRARMLWAVVDSENNVTYYEILRMKP